MVALITSTMERACAQISAASGASPWSRLLRRVLGSDSVARVRATLRSLTGGRRVQPVFRITRVWMVRWVVVRPGATMEHAFSTLDEAVAFVRHEAGSSPVGVELYIGDLYVGAFYDPNRPSPLFGEAE